ncbi:hypothetical protein [Arcobacter sp. LA11]|uniref:hypothetical protein n=1 Tax=Arcobacter sp. LA11 TaxID=1898176 RepID=UPI000933E1CE|nr:hypothetical protein [Arcobacter sp. LA11]
MFSNRFNALSKECSFAYEILASGVTQIRKANYAKKGIYYQSFISLSVGLERISKLCILLDYYISNNGEFPTDKFLRKLGHNINKLYKKSVEIKEKYDFNFNYLNSLDSEIHKNMINILSDFATRDRYENLNVLVNASQENNPISLWFNLVDVKLFDKHISEKKKQKIVHNADIIHMLTGQFTSVLHSSEDGGLISDVREGSFRTGVYSSVSPYRQLYLAQIVRYWTELLWKLQYKAMAIGKEEIPYFSDMFGCFYNDNSYFRGIRNYEK